MNNFELFIGLFSISGCFWILAYLYSNFSIKEFIVRRYKVETDLVNTVFFKDHAKFIRYLPDFLSAGFFGTHLLMCAWGWRLYRDKEFFSDIERPECVTQHFSSKEIRNTKKMLLCGIILFLHIIAYFLIRVVWPDAFD